MTTSTNSKNSIVLIAGLIALAFIVVVAITCMYHPLSDLHLDLPSK